MRRRGLTLIEVLLWISIAAILAAVASPPLVKWMAKKQLFPLQADTLLLTQTAAPGIEIEYTVARDIPKYKWYDDPDTPDSFETRVPVVATVKSRFAGFATRPGGVQFEHPSSMKIPLNTWWYVYHVVVPVDVDDDVIFVTTDTRTDPDDRP